jgi:hypothetical protein
MARRTDNNQSAIIQALRDIGCSVQDLSQLGRGCPDLLIGFRMRNFLLEIKNCEDHAPRLTDCEERWIKAWAGQVAVVTNVADAIAIVQDIQFEALAAQNAGEEGRG